MMPSKTKISKPICVFGLQLCLVKLSKLKKHVLINFHLCIFNFKSIIF